MCNKEGNDFRSLPLFLYSAAKLSICNRSAKYFFNSIQVFSGNIKVFFTNSLCRLLNFVHMLRYLVIALIVYFLYNFLFRFLLPVGKAAREMKKRVNEFQERTQQPGVTPNPEPQTNNRPPAKAGDYIDFEEVKES